MSVNYWKNWRGDARPFPALIKTDAAAEAARLWDVVEQRRAHLHDVEEAHRTVERAVRDAQVNYEAEVQRAAQAGEVSADEPLLHAEWARLSQELEPIPGEGVDGPRVHDERRRAAATVAQHAEQEYLSFITQNADSFLEALVPLCVETAEEYVATTRANEEANRKRLRPVEERSFALRDAVQLVIGGDMRFSEADLPEGIEFHKPQLPTDVLAAIEQERLAHADDDDDDESLPES